jgi:hypothetical protein
MFRNLGSPFMKTAARTRVRPSRRRLHVHGVPLHEDGWTYTGFPFTKTAVRTRGSPSWRRLHVHGFPLHEDGCTYTGFPFMKTAARTRVPPSWRRLYVLLHGVPPLWRRLHVHGFSLHEDGWTYRYGEIRFACISISILVDGTVCIDSLFYLLDCLYRCMQSTLPQLYTRVHLHYLDRCTEHFVITWEISNKCS